MGVQSPNSRKSPNGLSLPVNATLAAVCFILGSLAFLLWRAYPLGAITVGVVLLPLMAALLVRLYMAWLRKRTVGSLEEIAHHSSARICPHCNYDRSGLSRRARCPECGNAP